MTDRFTLRRPDHTLHIELDAQGVISVYREYVDHTKVARKCYCGSFVLRDRYLEGQGTLGGPDRTAVTEAILQRKLA